MARKKSGKKYLNKCLSEKSRSDTENDSFIGLQSSNSAPYHCARIRITIELTIKSSTVR